MSNLADQIEQFIGTVDRYEFFWEAFSTMRNESQGASIASGASATMSDLHLNRHNTAMDALRIGQSIASNALIPESESRVIYKVINACKRADDIRNLWSEAKVDLQCLVKNIRTVPGDPGGPPDGTETIDGDYSLTDLQNMTGFTSNALNKYAKQAKVATPSRGQRNFRYSADAVKTILKYIIVKCSQKENRALAEKALGRLL